MMTAAVEEAARAAAEAIRVGLGRDIGNQNCCIRFGNWIREYHKIIRL
jgi:hypothetical protein